MRCVLLSHVYVDPANRGKLRALAGLGCEVVAAVPGGETTTDGAVRIVPVGTLGGAGGRGADAASHKWNAKAIRRLLSDLRPEIVQVEEEPESVGAGLAVAEASRLGIPTVLFSWESVARPYSLLERRRRQKVLQRTQGLIGGNTLATGLLQAEAPGLPTLTLPQHGIVPPPAPERPTRAERPALTPGAGPAMAIGFVGRLLPERGVDTLLRACSQVMGQWTLRIVGTGPEQEALEDLSQRLGLASRVQWLGPLGRVETDALWPELDCLVVPSRDTPTWVDRYSPVLISAMVHGVAPVVAAAGVLPETVGDAGMIVRSLDDLTVALQRLLADPAACTALGLAARRRILAEHPDPVVAARTLEFWRVVRGG